MPRSYRCPHKGRPSRQDKDGLDGGTRALGYRDTTHGTKGLDPADGLARQVGMRNMDRCGLSHMPDMEATGERAGNGEILYTEHLLKSNPHAGGKGSGQSPLCPPRFRDRGGAEEYPWAARYRFPRAVSVPHPPRRAGLWFAAPDLVASRRSSRPQVRCSGEMDAKAGASMGKRIARWYGAALSKITVSSRP